MKRLLVVGGGMAAGKLLQELVALGCRDEIVLAGREGPGIYNRIGLAPALTGKLTPDFWVVPPGWFADHGIRVLPGHNAKVLDRQSRTVTFHNGHTEGYDTLVLAQGSRPLLPPIGGLSLAGVHTLRTLHDAKRLRADLTVSRTILVIGGGTLGLEAALELQKAGHSLTLAPSASGLANRHLDPTGAAFLRRHLETSGLRVLTGETCQALVGREWVERVRFQSGLTVEADLVLVATGVVPETGLARGAGLEVGRGILVDDRLATSDPAIYAVGECLEHRGRLWGLVSTTYDQARTLARILVGEPATFQPVDHPPTRLKSAVFMASLGTLGSDDGDLTFEFKDPVRGVYKKVILREGRIRGAQAVGSLSDEDQARWDDLEVAYAAGTPLAVSPGEFLFSPGAAPASDPGAWPEDLRLCHCNGVSAGDIRRVMATGADSFEAVVKATRAGTGCSSCRARVRSLVEATSPAPQKKAGPWSRFRRAYREKEIRGFTPYWIVSYTLDFLMLAWALVVVATGLLKFPGLLGALGFSIRRLPMDLFMALHDWGGLAITAAVVLHLVIHWGMMASFLRSMLKRRSKGASEKS